MKKIIVTTLLLTTLLVGCSSANIDETTVTEDVLGPAQTEMAIRGTKPVEDFKLIPEMKVAFTKENQRPESLLIEVIKGSKQTLDVAIYSLTKPEIVSAIVDAKNRGVQVRVITDKQQAGGATQKSKIAQLKLAGIQVKQKTSYGLMHLKMTVADKKIATTGSFNYSDAASSSNEEMLVEIVDDQFAQFCSKEFDRMWTDTKNFKDL